MAYGFVLIAGLAAAGVSRTTAVQKVRAKSLESRIAKLKSKKQTATRVRRIRVLEAKLKNTNELLAQRELLSSLKEDVRGGKFSKKYRRKLNPSQRAKAVALTKKRLATAGVAPAEVATVTDTGITEEAVLAAEAVVDSAATAEMDAVDQEIVVDESIPPEAEALEPEVPVEQQIPVEEPSEGFLKPWMLIAGVAALAGILFLRNR